jgi:murein DD-endopeptidase MepM/ murein hydrolase activator NlpD
MSQGRIPDMLVVVDAHPGSRAGLTIAERYATGTAVLASWQVAGGLGVDADVRPSAAPDPTIAEALRMAAHRGIGMIGLRRDIAGPQELLTQLLLGTARHADDEVPGFAVFLADGEPPPFRRILGIVDTCSAPVSGLAAHVAVTLADTADAILDVIVIGPEGRAEQSDDELELLAINREQELFEQAVALANARGVDVRFVSASGADHSWTLVRDQLGYRDYDLVICGLGDLSLGPALRRREAIDEVLSPGQVGELPMRLLTATDLPLLLVLDEVRLGIAPSTILRAGTVAALTIGIVGAGAVPAATHGTPAPTTAGQESVEPGFTDLGSPQAIAVALEAAIGAAQEAVLPEEASPPEPAEQTVAAAAGPDPEEPDATRRAADAAGASRSAGAGGGARAAAQAAQQAGQDAEASPASDAAPAAEEASERKPKPPKPPKGGADPKDVRKAQAQLERAKAARAEEKQALAEARTEVDEAQAAVDEAQAAATVALADLEAARLSHEEATSYAERTESAAAGIAAVLPGRPTAEDQAVAREVEQRSQERLEEAIVRGEDALGELASAEETIIEAEESLAEQRATAAEARDEYLASKEKLEVYRASLAESRQAPVARGSYRLTARFGQHGGYWSGGVHTGLDFAGAQGTPILAAATGKVVSAGYEGAYGNRVVVDHGDGYQTTYNHLSAIEVRVGEQVRTGDRIGRMGSTGNSTGSHLHFEVQHHDQFLNPEGWLGW